MKKSNINYILTFIMVLFSYIHSGGQATQGNKPKPHSGTAQNAPASPSPQIQPKSNPQPPQQPQMRPPNQSSQVAEELEDEENLPAWKKDKKSGIKEVSLTAYAGAGVAPDLDSVLIGGKVVMKFDNSGNMIEKHIYNIRGAVKMTFKYDANGRDILDSIFNHDSVFDYKTVTKYNEQGTTADYSIIKSNGNIMSKSEKAFNSKGELIEEKAYDAGGKPTWTVKIKYDDQENPIESSFSNPSQSMPFLERKSTSKYDSKGNRIEKEDYIGGKLQDKSIYTYDDKGNILVKVTIYTNGNVKIDRKEYIYDSFGNWVVKTEFPNTIVVQDIIK